MTEYCCTEKGNCCQSEKHHHHHHHEAHGHWGGAAKQIAVSAGLLIAAVIIEKSVSLPLWQVLLIYLVPYLLIGFSTLKEAAEGLLHGEVFNEHLLMAVATLGAMAIGFLPDAEPEFAEAVAVMLLFNIGELFEGYAEGKSRESISHLMNIRPDVANVERDGQTVCVPPSEVRVGEVIIVRPGEKVPIDGVIIEGETSVNTIAITGESLPRRMSEGDEIFSGCINISGVVKVRTTKSFGESTVSKIIDLVENAKDNKSKSESFISRFSKIYTPIVVFSAIGLAVLPPLFSGSFMEVFPEWLYRALMFLIVSCPCAFVISVPLTFFGGIGGASRNGILIKGSSYFDTLAKVGTVVFDKTGTLTHGQFAVTAVHPEKFDERQLLHLAAHVEHFSTHPIGAALRDAFPEEATDGCVVSNVIEIAGKGIQAQVGQDSVAVGNSSLMESIGAKWRDCHHAGTIIHVAVNGEYEGHIVINDKIKEDSAAAVEKLKQIGVSRIVMLTGDRQEVGSDVAKQLKLTDFHAGLFPADKVSYMEQLIKTEPAGSNVAFVGDGINDAPVLARADVGIAMGGLGSDAAIEAADVVLMDDKPSKIAVAIGVARRTIAIARQNIAFAVGVKASVLALAAFGIGTMWMAVFADVGVTVLAVLNAMRALKNDL